MLTTAPSSKLVSNGKTQMLARFMRMRKLFSPLILWRIILTTFRWTTPKVYTHLRLPCSTAPSQRRAYPKLSSLRNQGLKHPTVESQLLFRWFVSSKLNSNKSRHLDYNLKKLSFLNRLTMLKCQEIRTIQPNPLIHRSWSWRYTKSFDATIAIVKLKIQAR